ncbi:hypothetical protein ARTSIC4J27_621 [Pseudarthrobacter siccitolerans]|uniref:Uncharacterized protein n=1 Tax=Pseudarthrobacter siccitolerans TaxID=861266 RepID=A0A024GYI4_9MICC|nr:hypothetical protein [Pseudarthrobacter siccitolerans]CCQ44692.1 hypothetical protein ARTSIC4J27_621 [Pseudarthrobacter siccitolerans]
MARTFTAQEHREVALALLDESLGKGIASPARSVILAEAQIHATLALSAPAEEKKPATRRKATTTKAEVTAAGKSFGDLPEEGAAK